MSGVEVGRGKNVTFEEFCDIAEKFQDIPQKGTETERDYFDRLQERYGIKRSRATLQIIRRAVKEFPGDLKAAWERYKAIQEEYKARNTSKKETEKLDQEQEQNVVDYSEQIKGQMEMDLTPEPEKKPEMSDSTKMMRFLAGQVGEIVKALNAITEELKKLNGGGNDGET